MMTAMYNALHLQPRPLATQWKIHSSLKRALHQTKLNLFLFLLLFLANSMLANNVQVSNVVLTGKNTTDDFIMVEFDLSWDNSWRVSTGSSNWDAAWVFIKFQVGARNPVLTGASSSGTTITVNSTTDLRVGMPVVVSAGTGSFAANTTISSITNSTQFEVSATPDVALSGATITCQRIWEHATLNTTASNHTAPSGSTLDVPSDGVGAFVYRDVNGSGTLSLTDVQLRWEYGTNEVRDGAVLQVQIFAIEMVYVTSGDFAAGSGGNEDNPFILTTINTATANTTPSGTGSLGGEAGGYPTGKTAPNASWPNGFNAFYCMKYEISQGQYRDFLNTLTRTQQNSRTESNCATGITSITNRYVMTNSTIVTNRNVIRCDLVVDANLPITFYCDLDLDGIGNESADGEWIACNFLNWMDACAYMDWAGLRPMTELEYEKACRGVATPGSNEYVAPPIKTATGVNNAGTSSETYGNTDPNFVFNNSTSGPYRVGVFSGTSTTRNQAGATYYGIMEMGGNVSEPTVTIDNTDGRVYTGLHGNGILSSNGHANTANWPGLVNGQLTTASGSGNRGGSFENAQADMRISDRSFAATAVTNRTRTYGCRAVRTAQ